MADTLTFGLPSTFIIHHTRQTGTINLSYYHLLTTLVNNEFRVRVREKIGTASHISPS